eukprot:6454829-Amphidinium_carterae.1
MSRATAEALWASNVCKECGLELQKVVLLTDAKAAWQNATRLGPGRLKHLRLGEMFVKEAVQAKRMVIVKIPGASNPADIIIYYTHEVRRPCDARAPQRVHRIWACQGKAQIL